MNFIQHLFQTKAYSFPTFVLSMKHIEEIIKSGNATIVDVRTRGEYMSGHVAGSINIPLQEISNRLEEIKKLKNIVLCCASGGRSAQVNEFLKRHGIESYDGGSWLNVNGYC